MVFSQSVRTGAASVLLDVGTQARGAVVVLTV